MATESLYLYDTNATTSATYLNFFGNPVSYNPWNDSAVGAGEVGDTLVFGNADTAGQSIKITDNDAILEDNDFTQQTAAEAFTTSEGTVAAGSYITHEYRYVIRPDGGATDGSDDITLYSVMNGSAFGDPVVGFLTSAPLDPAATYTIVSVDSLIDEFAYADAMPCFTTGTLITTDRGQVAIEDLRQGDLVMTKDHGLQAIKWIGGRRVSPRTLAANAKLTPIRIQAGALGEGLPKQDLLVSPQHRMVVRSTIAQRMFGANEVLVAAKQLCQIDGVDIAQDLDQVDYFHMLFDRHEIVFAHGAETESLYTGPEALKALGAEAREEIFMIFPELNEVDYQSLSARPIASGRNARHLAVRHKNNNKSLMEQLVH